jgi:hypothetical protein
MLRLVLVAAALLSACTATVPGHGATTGRSSGTEPATSARPTPTLPPSCSTYARPDPTRPRMTLRFSIAPGHATVHGTEDIVFTPDLPITELVFRLTANTAPTAAEGNKIVVTAASAHPAAGAYTFTSANAGTGTQGGLLHIPFRSSVAAGTTVTAHTAFDLTLGAQSFDRFGRAGEYAYFGSGEPLLAWERGVGWHTEGMANFPAESATSEAMQVDLTVVAPAADTVIMSGDPSHPTTSGATRTWHAHLAAARDVSVAAGPFAVSDTTVHGVRLRIGAPGPGALDLLVPEFQRAITELTKRFGPFPFPSLSVARVPARGGGIEYPSSILMLDGSRLVAVHETAHQWFYAMVGDSQALHPWLDEAFATYAEALVDHTAYGKIALRAPGDVDRSTESYGHDMARYYVTTYSKGAAALLAARSAAGPATWDLAIRCYVAHNAWRIANPADLEAAVANLPAGVAVLRKAGALP